MLKLYFCFPYHGVGGVSLLFLRVAEFLSRKKLAECHLVDYADGFMANNLRAPGVILEVYQDQGTPVVIPGGAIGIFQSMTPWSIFPGIHLDPACRIFFWNCYPFNLVPLFPGLRRTMQHRPAVARWILGTLLRVYRQKMRRLVDLMLEKDALVFMDSTNVNTTCEYLGVSIPNPRYLPIPVPASGDRRAMLIKRDLRASGLRVVWVGRVVDFKFFILQRSLIELNRLAPRLSIQIKVTMVGSGDYRQALDQTISNLPHLHYEFVDYVAPADLDEFLISKADLLLAMGTSALEGARLGIPTLLLDVAHGPVSADYVFRWIYERQGFTLGNILSERDYTKGNTSLEDRIADLLRDFPRISARCLGYFFENHEMSHVAVKLMGLLVRTDCTYADMQRADMIGRGMIYSIFAGIKRGIVRP
jgi:glycosyltransferase involved in cell wall biosynthesis